MLLPLGNNRWVLELTGYKSNSCIYRYIYRCIHRYIYSYNAITLGKVTGGLWNPPVTNRIPASIVISIATGYIQMHPVTMHDRTVAILVQVLSTSF